MKPQQSKSQRKYKKQGASILRLRKKGLSYNQIQKTLKCSKATISYHCGKNQSEKKRVRGRKPNPLCRKVASFKTRCTAQSWKTFRIKVKTFKRRNQIRNKVKVINNYTCEDVVKKLGTSPCCYLTGKSINLKNPKSYSLDHIMPVSQGGTNELNNLEITCARANSAKADMTLQEFYKLCEDVLKWKDKKNRK